jgi:acetyl-CoA carboxylase carboxyl transferase subunit alpha
MSREYLDFERPLAELQQKIEELCQLQSEGDISITEEVKKLREKLDAMTRSVFSKLTPQQIVQMARHPNRPHSKDYINAIFTDFDEMHGDRHFARASALIGGMARLDGQSVMVLGQQKGRSTKEKVDRNFGMLKPEGFRKALRLMKLAEKFSLPVITFIDTPGAYPGIGAEERNQSEAIARNLLEMSQLKVPILCVVIGEGCSGGALGIGVGDRIIMLQYSYYSVISPEGCASILWKSAERAADAADALGLTAQSLQKNKLIDEVLEEPLGGAHCDLELMSERIKQSLLTNLETCKQLSLDEMLQNRYDYWMAKGRG